MDYPRYNFQNKYTQRKLFKINYSFYPYLNISRKKSYKENAINIYKSTGMLNISKLDFYFIIILRKKMKLIFQILIIFIYLWDLIKIIPIYL